jgi:hypothetical protein
MTLTGLYGLRVKRRSNDYRKSASVVCASWLIIVIIPQVRPVRCRSRVNSGIGSASFAILSLEPGFTFILFAIHQMKVRWSRRQLWSFTAATAALLPRRAPPASASVLSLSAPISSPSRPANTRSFSGAACWCRTWICRTRSSTTPTGRASRSRLRMFTSCATLSSGCGGESSCSEKTGR